TCDSHHAITAAISSPCSSSNLAYHSGDGRPACLLRNSRASSSTRSSRLTSNSERGRSRFIVRTTTQRTRKCVTLARFGKGLRLFKLVRLRFRQAKELAKELPQLRVGAQSIDARQAEDNVRQRLRVNVDDRAVNDPRQLLALGVTPLQRKQPRHRIAVHNIGDNVQPRHHRLSEQATLNLGQRIRARVFVAHQKDVGQDGHRNAGVITLDHPLRVHRLRTLRGKEDKPTSIFPTLRQDSPHCLVLADSAHNFLGVLELGLRFFALDKQVIRHIQYRITGKVSLDSDGLNDFDSFLEVIWPVSRPQNRPRLGRILCRGRAEEQQLLNRDKHSRRLPRLPVNALLNTLNAALIIKHPSVNRILATNRQLLPP